MASFPEFTVIMTTYNRAHLLTRAVESVLSQTLRDFELLVIDNGSTDATREVVRSISDDRVAYVRNPRPTDSCDGPRNLGIEMARGKLIAFLDDDDIWYPERLAKVKAAFDAHPEAIAVCHDEHRNVNGRIEGVLRYGPWSDDLHERLLYERNCLSSCGTTVRVEVLRRLGGFDLRREISGAGDYDMWIRMTEDGSRVFFLNEPLGEFSLTGANASSVDAAFGEKVALVVRTHLIRHEKRPFFMLSKTAMWRLFKLYAFAGKSYLKRGRNIQGVVCVGRASLLVARRPSLVLELSARRSHE